MKFSGEIIPAGPGDLDRLIFIENTCFSQPWSRESLIFALSSPGVTVLTARQEQSIMGYAVMQIVLDEGDIGNVAVLPEARQKGMGSALLDALIGIGREAGLTVLTLEVRESNSAARSLYARKGFVEVGRRPWYYDLPREDAILMDLCLLQGDKEEL